MIVKGGGDPNISGRFGKSPTELFEKVADDVLKAGVKKITGDLVLDDTMFDRQYVHPDWPRDELEKWYSTGTSALSFNDNCVGVVVGPGKKAGDAAVVKVSPTNGCVSIVNKCVTTGSKKLHSFSVTRSASGNHITVKGKFYVKAKSYRVDVAVYRPPLFFGDVLKRVLAAKGVAVGGKVKLAPRPFDAKADGLFAVASLESPLLRTLEVLNGRSQNFYAEQMFKTLGYAKEGKGTFSNGAEAVSAFFARIGAADKGTVVADGSGLSRKNRLTADTVSALLVAMYDEKYRDDFIATLSVAGRSGSASSRLKEEPYAGRLFVKTGTMSGVSTLAGYAKNLDGRWFAFVVMSNGFPLARTTEFKKLEDEICRLIVRLK
jgi:D-alanyl-D-alanine carboxypeptidase/D-alanyl-D-alanine-endopeptidase (penicillin-binding protein 4)